MGRDVEKLCVSALSCRVLSSVRQIDRNTIKFNSEVSLRKRIVEHKLQSRTRQSPKNEVLVIRQEHVSQGHSF